MLGFIIKWNGEGSYLHDYDFDSDSGQTTRWTQEKMEAMFFTTIKEAEDVKDNLKGFIKEEIEIESIEI